MVAPRDLPKVFFDRVWNDRDASGIDEMIHPDMMLEGVEGEPIEGVAGFKDLHNRLCAAFSDFDIEIKNVVCEGNMVAFQHHGTAKHVETGKVVPLNGTAIGEVVDGKFMRAMDCLEWLTTLQQLDLVPADALDQLLG